MLRFGETKVAKENCYGAKKKIKIKIWDIDVNYIIIFKLIATKTIS